MIAIVILWCWIFLYITGIVVQSLGDSVLDVVLVDSLSYNESGNIHSLTWRRTTGNAPSYNYQLVAASLSTSQVWNYTAASGSNGSAWKLVNILDFFVVKPLNKSTETNVRAVSFSPNKRWLAIGGDAGLVQVWSISTVPWTLRRTLSTTTNGKIRSLSWHSNTLYLAAAGTNFGVQLWDVNHGWNSTLMEPRSPLLPPPPNDSYVHYVDWSPVAMGSTRHLFVADTTVHEIGPVANIFSESTPATARAIAVLSACHLCTLPQWSPDGQMIATAFGDSISISQRRTMNTTNGTDSSVKDNWESIQNLTTVTESYMVITAMEWSPNGKYLAVGGAGQAFLFLYDSNDWNAAPLTIATSTGVGLDALAWRPDGAQIAIGTDRRIEIFAIREPAPISSPPMSIIEGPLSPTMVPSRESGSTSLPSMQDSGLSFASMTGIGVAAIAVSFTIVGIVFCQRMRLVTKRKRRKHEFQIDNNPIRDGDFTATEDYFDHPSHPLSDN